MFKLHNLSKLIEKRKKRVGRGYGSGKGGHTAGKGQKGQNSRGSYKVSPTFDGDNTGYYKKIPLLGGFKSTAERPQLVKTSSINKLFKNDQTVNPVSLYKAKLIKSSSKSVKVLSDEKLSVKVKFEGVKCSKNVL